MIDKRDRDFSVIIPYFKNLSTIRDALLSVSSQTLPPANTILVDDGSGDDLKDICDEFGVTLVVSDTNRGSAIARNSGLKLVNTTYVALLDADDIWHPCHLRLHSDLWGREEENLAAIGTTMKRVKNPMLNSKFLKNLSSDGHNDSILAYPSNYQMSLNNPFFNSATTFRTLDLISHNGWGQVTPSFSEDYDLLTRFLLSGKRIGFYDFPTGIYRIQESSKSTHYPEIFAARLKTAQDLHSSKHTNSIRSRLIWRSTFYYIYFSTLMAISNGRNEYLTLSIVAAENFPLFRFLDSKLQTSLNWRIFQIFFRPLRLLRMRSILNLFLRKEVPHE